jgi:hypothetical protein
MDDPLVDAGLVGLRLGDDLDVGLQGPADDLLE